MNSDPGLSGKRWDFYSALAIVAYAFLQLVRLPLLPQSMDIYYHLLNARGFIQAGGYTGWDFWQYAPVGRPNIYPPFFHILLAFLMKAGLNPVFLAKFFEAVTPVIFLISLRFFVKRNFGGALAFFCLVAFSSSFSFFLSLSGHLPATLALTFGLLAFDQLFRRNFLRALLLLTLCFYTHIGVSWFLALGFVFWGVLDRDRRRGCLWLFVLALFLSLPMLLKEFSVMGRISALGIDLNERMLSQIKVADYFFAGCGVFFALRLEKKFRFFLALLFAGAIFLFYPYRFFSTEGYLPVAFLSAVFLYGLYLKGKNRRPLLRMVLIAICLFILFISPTLTLGVARHNRVERRREIKLFDSALMGMLLARGQVIWFPREYLPAARLIRENSAPREIIYSPMEIAGVILAGLSGRPTANALLPEIAPAGALEPLESSKIVIFPQDDPGKLVEGAAGKHGLRQIGQNKLFLFYRNPAATVKVEPKKATLSFGLIMVIAAVFFALLIVGRVSKKD